MVEKGISIAQFGQYQGSESFLSFSYCSALILRAIFWEIQAKPESDILRFSLFSNILYKIKKIDTCEYFFWKFPSVPEKQGAKFWPFLGKIGHVLNEVATLKGKYVAMKMIITSFDIFTKYGQNFIINVQKICLLTFHWLEIMVRNYKIWKISWTLNLNITLWPLLAHRLLWFFWKSFGSTFIPWKKVSVQVMAWVWAMAWNLLFVQNVPLKITHNGVGLRSDIRRGGFLASSNIVL